MTARHRVVIVGGGFGGLAAAKALRRAPVDVTVVDRQAHHLFQPLLYQVATGVLSQGNIAPPLRDVLRHRRNAEVVLAEVGGVDPERRVVECSLLDRTWGVERLDAMTKIWSAGVQASPLGSMLAAQAGVEPTRTGQVPVERDYTLPEHPEVFVVGDLMALDRLPGLPEVATKSGRHAASEIRRRLGGNEQPRPFQYRELGSLAAVSRYYAIGERRRARVWGFVGWLFWLVVHLTFLTGFKNRVSALFHCTISFFGRSRPERTITAQQIFARQALAASVRAGELDE
jgi:NADH dehydrogenase FAD-containing subunit